ncbi:CzcE family metal-binding protein [Oxalobacteraceae bacterium OM1]|nr:CzcE family metal-binding protein [Oxalobacteraceae bacterium OM1]
MLLAVAGAKAEHIRKDLLGDAVPPSDAYRTIVIGSDTRFVNVTGDEVVNFMVDGKRFAWRFPIGTGVRSFSLNEVAPEGVLSHPVRAYIAPDPLYVQE